MEENSENGDEHDHEPLLKNNTNIIQDSSDNQHDCNRREISQNKSHYWKNLIVMCASFMLIFTSFQSLQNLQSTINENAGVGVVSLAVHYTTAVFTSLLAPVVVYKIGCKWSILTGFFCQVTFTLCNMYPTFFTLIPSSILVGCSASFLWTAQGTYITKLAIDYGSITDTPKIQTINRFNGIFFMFIQTCQIWGNLFSSIVLHQGNHSHITNTSLDVSTCGYHFCDVESNKNHSHNLTSNYSDFFKTFLQQESEKDQIQSTDHPSKTLVYILIGIYFFCDLLGIILTLFFMDKRTVFEANQQRSLKERITCTSRLHGNVLVLLLLPLFLYNGVSQAFLFGDYTEVSITILQYITHVIRLVYIVYNIYRVQIVPEYN